MQTLQFTQTINAPKEHVWNVMLEKPTYEKRTTAFSEGSTYE
jgi:ligand-binding SRPBCC domain-containing protein